MSPERQQPVKEKNIKKGMSMGELAAAFNALGHPVAFKIMEKLSEPEPPPQIKK